MLVNIGLNHFVPYGKNYPIAFSQLQGDLRGKSSIKYYSVNVTKLETTKMVIVAGIGATWQPNKKIRNIFYSHTKTNL